MYVDCCNWNILQEKGRKINDFYNKNGIDRWIRFVDHRVKTALDYDTKKKPHFLTSPNQKDDLTVNL